MEGLPGVDGNRTLDRFNVLATVGAFFGCSIRALAQNSSQRQFLGSKCCRYSCLSGSPYNVLMKIRETVETSVSYAFPPLKSTNGPCPAQVEDAFHPPG